MKQCLNYKCKDYNKSNSDNCRYHYLNLSACDFIKKFPQIAEEKPEIKPDPYVGKIVINKNDTNNQSMIVKINEYYRVIAYGNYETIEDLKKDWYIQGEDF
jgi:hypothetical protein